MKKTFYLLFIALVLSLTACKAPLFGQTPFPTLFVPTPDCGSPTLVLGTKTFQIQNLTRASDGSLTVPADTSGIAYWVEGTNTNYVFVLSPTQENISLASSLTEGTTAKATWKNCNSTTYSLSAAQPGSVKTSTSPDQSAEGITVLFQTDSSGAGILFTGDLGEQQISTFNTPVSNGTEIQAEISILETKTSEDGKTIKISASIQNTGQATLTLSPNDVSLTPQDTPPLQMDSSDPALPKEIQSGKTETINFTFPRPTTQSATLKIFEVEYDINGY